MTPQVLSPGRTCAPIVDSPVAGPEMLAQEARRRRKLGGGLYLYRAKAVIKEFLSRGGHLPDIGEENFFPVRSRPTERLYQRLDPEICRHCQARIFRECHERLPDGTPRATPLSARARQ